MPAAATQIGLGRLSVGSSKLPAPAQPPQVWPIVPTPAVPDGGTSQQLITGVSSVGAEVTEVVGVPLAGVPLAVTGAGVIGASVTGAEVVGATLRGAVGTAEDQQVARPDTVWQVSGQAWVISIRMLASVYMQYWRSSAQRRPTPFPLVIVVGPSVSRQQRPV